MMGMNKKDKMMDYKGMGMSKGGMTKKPAKGYAKGGMVKCGASNPPAQKGTPKK